MTRDDNDAEIRKEYMTMMRKLLFCLLTNVIGHLSGLTCLPHQITKMTKNYELVNFDPSHLKINLDLNWLTYSITSSSGPYLFLGSCRWFTSTKKLAISRALTSQVCIKNVIPGGII